MGLVRVTPPTVEPVTLAEAKEHARVDTGLTADDGWISARIKTVREFVENRARRALIKSGWRWTLDSFGDSSRVLRPPMPPLLEVTAIKYRDTDDVEQTLAGSKYRVGTASKPGKIQPVDAWPATADRIEAVNVEFNAGYGVDAATVPEVYRQAILMLIAYWYEQRESYSMQVTDLHRDLPMKFDDILRVAGVTVEYA